MEDSDLDNLRNTPGFKPILRAILKSQMKHLVEQLSRHGGEEAMLLTASVTDASFNHLGSTLTEGFLDSRKEIKNQFLVYCMKGSQENKDQNEKVSPGTRSKNSRRPSIISPVSLIKVVPEPGDGTNIQSTGVAKEGATFSSPKSMKNGRKRPGAAMSSYTPPKRASISETVTQALQAISAETEHEMEGETVGSLKVESDHDDPDYTPNETADSSDTLSLDLGTGTKERHDRMKEFSDNEQSGPKFDLDACDPEKVKVEPGDDVDESKDQSDLDVNTGAAVDGEGATETVTKTGETSLHINYQMVPIQPLPPDQPEVARKLSEYTERKTKTDMQLIKDYLLAVGETRGVETIPLKELDIHFGKFLLNVRKQDGSRYGASSLHAIVASFNRYLGDKRYQYRVSKGSEFKYSQSVLNQKLTELKSLVVQNACEDNKLKPDDVEKLFQLGEIGLHNPKALMQFLYISIVCGLGVKRGAQMYNLKWGDIVLCVMDNGVEFLTHVKFVDPLIDSQTSDLIVMNGSKPKVFGNAKKNRCPLEAYKLYASKRPVTVNAPNSPFLLSPVSKSRKVGQAWFTCRCIGINAAGGLMKELIRKSRQ